LYALISTEKETQRRGLSLSSRRNCCSNNQLLSHSKCVQLRKHTNKTTSFFNILQAGKTIAVQVT
jgi:hypothetical protein